MEFQGLLEFRLSEEDSDSLGFYSKKKTGEDATHETWQEEDQESL